MKLETDIYGVVALLAIFHSIAVGVFLMFQLKRRGISALFLGLTQVSGAVILVSSLTTTTNLFVLFPQLIGVPYPFIFLTGFFSLFYIYSLIEGDEISIRRLWLFAIGPAAGIGLSIPLFLMNGTDRLDYLFYVRRNQNYPGYDWIIWLTGLVYNWSVLATALLRIRRYRNTLMKERSNTEGIEFLPE